MSDREATNDIEFFWSRRDVPAARDELRLALKNERKSREVQRRKEIKVSQAYRLESLKGLAAWDELKALLEEQEEKFWQRHIADVKAGKAIDQRELDRALGKLDGIRAILGAPEKAAKIIEAVNNSEEKPRE